MRVAQGDVWPPLITVPEYFSSHSKCSKGLESTKLVTSLSSSKAPIKSNFIMNFQGQTSVVEGVASKSDTKGKKGDAGKFLCYSHSCTCCTNSLPWD